MLIDSHCHLNFSDFDADRENVIARARQAGVYRMVNVATSQAEWPRVRQLTAVYYDVYGTVGVHPHEAAKETVTAERLACASEGEKIVGIGETGLDYYYDFAPREAQIALFREHIRAARMTNMPLIVHTRDAEDDTIRLLQAEAGAGKGGLRGVIHCYSSGRRLAEAALALGFYISFSGILTFKKAEEIQAIAKDIPLNRLLVETDSPYLAPIPMRGKPCEPSYVVHTARCLAALRGMEEEALHAATTENFFSLFTKACR